MGSSCVHTSQGNTHTHYQGAKQEEKCELSHWLAVSSSVGQEGEHCPYLGFPSQPTRWDPVGERKRGRVRQSPRLPIFIAVKRAFHSCAHLGQAGLKCEEQRVPGEREGGTVHRVDRGSR